MRSTSNSTGVFGAVLIALAMLAALVLPAIARPSAMLVLGGVAALFASVAVGGLVHLVVTDIRR